MFKINVAKKPQVKKYNHNDHKEYVKVPVSAPVMPKKMTQEEIENNFINSRASQLTEEEAADMERRAAMAAHTSMTFENKYDITTLGAHHNALVDCLLANGVISGEDLEKYIDNNMDAEADELAEIKFKKEMLDKTSDMNYKILDKYYQCYADDEYGF